MRTDAEVFDGHAQCARQLRECDRPTWHQHDWSQTRRSTALCPRVLSPTLAVKPPTKQANATWKRRQIETLNDSMTITAKIRLPRGRDCGGSPLAFRPH